MKNVCFLILVFAISLKICFAQQGKNGAETITVNNTVVNEYTSLTSDAAAGNTSITVSNNSLNTNNRFSASLSAGDLIMIIQMQGAIIKSTLDSTWGDVTDYGNCGLNEFAQVAGVSGTTIINLKCPLQNSYSASGRVQVIRVPRYTTLTINANDTLTCDTWEGNGTAAGGVVAVEVQNGTTINAGGAISATAQGFRGGLVANSGSVQVTDTFAATDIGYGAQKGEGIAGFQADYTAYGGMYGRGAPANGGGGGDTWNCGGGGGANAGDTSSWTGNGNTDITSNPNYEEAWNLEYPGFSNSTSSGGGRGGYSSANNQNDPFTDGPGNSSWSGSGTLWGGRNNDGGKGGRPLDYSTGRLFMGGGGGAGHEDNSHAGNGGAGGGIVYLLSYGTIGGSGSIISNGQNGGKDSLVDGDGPGGAGGGGTVIINSLGAISGISAAANGGTGGVQTITVDESEGPGGGGGGGYVATSNGGIVIQALGGANGTTTSHGVTPFLPNGATAGGNGMDSMVAPICILSLNAITGDTMVCSGLSYTYSIAPSCSNMIYTWTLPSGWSGISTINSITAIAGTSGGTIQVSASNGGCPLDTTIMVTVYPAPVNPDFPKDTLLCGVINLPLNSGSTGFNYLWSTGDTTTSIVVTDTGTYWLQVSDNCDTLRDSITIIQMNKPTVFIGNDTSYCSSFIRVLNAGDSAVTYKWSTGDTTKTITINTDGTYWVMVSNGCGQAADTIKITSCEGGYILPNAFTPGEENANSLIGLLKTGNGNTTLLNFRIYSRWGELIFSTNDDQAKWDGRFNGLPQPIGVYIYVVSYNDSFGVNKLLKGNITLLR